MSLNPENFTEKTNQILVAAQDLARETSNVQLAPVHLALALFTDADGLAKNICKKGKISGTLDQDIIDN